MDFDWFGGATERKDPWDKDTIWDDMDTDTQTERTENSISLRSLDPHFINDLISLKHHCYDITVTQDPLDSDRAQSMDSLQDYIRMLSTIYTVLLNAPYDTEQRTALPASVQEHLAPLLEWIRQFCETNHNPADRIPFQSYVRMNIIENPYVQSKIIE